MGKLAKPINLITELSGDEAKEFKDMVENPKPNSKREATLKRARNIDFGF